MIPVSAIKGLFTTLIEFPKLEVSSRLKDVKITLQYASPVIRSPCKKHEPLVNKIKVIDPFGMLLEVLEKIEIVVAEINGKGRVCSMTDV
jgi:hypothetical protein